MAQYGLLQGTILDGDGNPISGANVEFRTQGAFSTGTQAGPTYSVNDPGGIIVTNTVAKNLNAAPTRTVSAVTAIQVTTSGPGLGTLNDEDRITVVSPLPTLSNDAQGTEAKTNPLVTDANGYYSAWAPIVPYDRVVSATGYGTRMQTDVLPEGHEYVQSNVFEGGGAIAFRRGTSRTLTSGLLFLLENPTAGGDKFRVDFAGNVVATGNISGVGGTFTGNLSVTGTGSITGNTTIGGTLGVTGLSTLSGGATVASAFTYSGAAGSFSLTAGSIETADLAAACVTSTGVGTGTTDQTLTAAAAFAAITSVSVTITPFSTASDFDIVAVIPMESAGAGAFLGYARIMNGATVLAEGGCTQNSATANFPETIALVARQTGLTGAQTWTVEARCVTSNAIILSSSTDRKARLLVVEHKK